MKKRISSLLIALVLVLTQAVIFPLAASADTWVDDENAPNGGYWIDDEGYIIGNSQPAPTPALLLVEGREGNDYSGNGAAPSASATTATITRIVSQNPAALQYTVTADGEVAFQFYSGSTLVDPQPEYTYSEGLLSVMDTSRNYLVKVCDLDGAVLAQSLSFREHSYEVQYNLEGSLVTVETGTLNAGDTGSHTAPLMYSDGTTEYELEGGEANATQLYSYGKGSYVFKYHIFNPADKTAVVTLVDERDNILESSSQTVTYRGGNVVFTVPASLEKDGRTYSRIDTINRVTVNYFSSSLEYKVRYREDVPANTEPYSVKVNYIDAQSGADIGSDFFTVTAQNIAAGDTVTFDVPKEIAVYSGDSTLYYQPESTVEILHNAADNGTVEYTIRYVQAAEDAPYTWSVRLVDVTTGTVLDTVAYQVSVTNGVTHVTEPAVTVDGVRYLLDEGMSAEYTHNYGDSSRIQYIYYLAEGSEAMAPYEISFRYVEIGTNTELFSGTETVSSTDTSLPVPSPDNYGVGDTEYVKLLGQENLTHSYYSPQRSYTVYYRDVNDVQNADTVVTREEVITVVTDEVVETETPAATTPATEPAVQVLPAVVDEEQPAPVQENTEVIDDENAPLAGGTTENGESSEGEEIPDEEAPLAGSSGLSEPSTDSSDSAVSTFNWVLLALAAAGVLAVLAIVILVVVRRKKQN